MRTFGPAVKRDGRGERAPGATIGPRGPKSGIRMEPDEVTEVVKPAGLLPDRIVDLSPYHYGVVLERRRE